jgi:hypothetical protein
MRDTERHVAAEIGRGPSSWPAWRDWSRERCRCPRASLCRSAFKLRNGRIPPIYPATPTRCNAPWSAIPATHSGEQTTRRPGGPHTTPGSAGHSNPPPGDDTGHDDGRHQGPREARTVTVDSKRFPTTSLDRCKRHSPNRTTFSGGRASTLGKSSPGRSTSSSRMGRPHLSAQRRN